MSGFFSRHGKAILCTVGASATVYLLYRFFIYKKQQIRAEALAGIEYRRMRVEKLVELRDKLVCREMILIHIVNDGTVVNCTN